MSHLEFSDSAAKAPAIDLMALLGRCLGNMKMVERVLTAFRETGSADLEQLLAAFEAMNFSAMAEIAHRFKGSSSNVSAITLNELSKRVESLAKEQNSLELPDALHQLRSAWTEFERVSRAFGTPTTTRLRGLDRQKQPALEPSYASACCGR